MSNLGLLEYVDLIATWEYYSNPKQYNCKVQLKKMKDLNRIEGFKNRNGCDKRVNKLPRQTHDTINFHDCYCNHLSPSFDSYIFIHDQYTKGFLPYSGSIMDQPNKAMDVINLISKLKYDREVKIQKDSKK